MKSLVRQVLGLAMIAGALLMSGCAVSSSGIQPVMTLDGQRIELNDPVERARGMVATGQYGLAVDALTQIVRDEPANVRAINLLAVTYAHLKRYDLADRYHQQALLIDANSVAALNNWGYSYLLRGDSARAVGLLERAAAVGKGYTVVAANLALATGQAGATAAAPSDGEPSVQREQNIRLSDHVVLVRRTGELRRLAPGVQLLVTKESPPASELKPQSLVSSTAEDSPDPRYAQFRRLFALFEGEQVAGTSHGPGAAPFLIAATIDNFSAL